LGIALLVAAPAAALKLEEDCPSCARGKPAASAPPRQADTPLRLRLDTLCTTCLTATPSAMAAGFNETFATLVVNLEPRGEVLVLVAQDGRVLMREDDFKALDLKGVSYTPTPVEGVPHVALASVEGLQVQFDLAKIELRLM